MEVDEPESGDSEPEDEGQPDKKDLPQDKADKEMECNVSVDEEGEGEDSCTEEGHQGDVNEEDWQTCSEGSDEEGETEEGATSSSRDNSFHNSSRLLHKEELLDMFKAAHNGPKYKDGQLTVGLVSKKLDRISQIGSFKSLQIFCMHFFFMFLIFLCSAIASIYFLCLHSIGWLSECGKELHYQHYLEE